MRKIFIVSIFSFLMITISNRESSAFFGLFGNPGMETESTIFHDIPDNYLNGKSVFITPNPETKIKRESLEFRKYSEMLSEYLIDVGMKVLTELEESELIIYMDYQISTNKKMVSEPIFGQTSTGGYSTYTGSVIGGGMHSGSIYTQPTYGITGYRQYEVEYYTRELNLSFFDKSINYAIYESQSISDGSTNSLPKTIRGLMVPLFNDFPGPESATKTSSISFKEHDPIGWQREADENKKKWDERRRKRKERDR
jgi:hypothetical protein